MKTCECGGMLYRHGTKSSVNIGKSTRYRCKSCGKCITVRGGKVSKLKGRPFKSDWRMAA